MCDFTVLLFILFYGLAGFKDYFSFKLVFELFWKGFGLSYSLFVDVSRHFDIILQIQWKINTKIRENKNK
jgi:hypothetical protein